MLTKQKLEILSFSYLYPPTLLNVFYLSGNSVLTKRMLYRFTFLKNESRIDYNKESLGYAKYKDIIRI